MSEQQPKPEVIIAPVEVQAYREEDGALAINFDGLDPDHVLFDEPEPGTWIFYDLQGNISGVAFDSEVSTDFCTRYLGSDFADKLNEGTFIYDVPESEQTSVLANRKELFRLLWERGVRAHSLQLLKELGGAGMQVTSEPSPYALELFRRYDEGDPGIVSMTFNEFKRAVLGEDSEQES